jgi:hypothetical protein
MSLVRFGKVEINRERGPDQPRTVRTVVRAILAIAV